MRPAILIGTSLGVLSSMVVLVQAGGTTHEEVIKEMLGTMDKLASTLATIQDEKTAKEAVSDLRTSKDRWLQLRKKADALKPPERDDKERLEKEYKAKIVAAQKKLFTEIARVKTISGGPEVLKEISTVLERKPKQ